MRKGILSMFWTVNTLILIMHFFNYFFNQGYVNWFGDISIFLYRILPYLNMLLGVIALIALAKIRQHKIHFSFDKKLNYLFLFILISISTSPAKSISDPVFIFYLITVIIFAIAVSFLPVTDKVSVKKGVQE